MSLKEFSQKHSLSLFYSTIVLAILVAVLGVALAIPHKGRTNDERSRSTQRNRIEVRDNNQDAVSDQGSQLPPNSQQPQLNDGQGANPNQPVSNQ